MCAIVFCLFSFGYIYLYQTPVIAYAQHTLSGGQTQYNPLIGALLITLIAIVLQLVTFRVTRLGKRCHALTYVPSMLFLAALTSCHKTESNGVEWDMWLWFIPLYLIIYVVIVRFVKQWLPARSAQVPVLCSPQLSLNLLIMVVMMILVCK